MRQALATDPHIILLGDLQTLALGIRRFGRHHQQGTSGGNGQAVFGGIAPALQRNILISLEDHIFTAQCAFLRHRGLIRDFQAAAHRLARQTATALAITVAGDIDALLIAPGGKDDITPGGEVDRATAQVVAGQQAGIALGAQTAADVAAGFNPRTVAPPANVDRIPSGDGAQAEILGRRQRGVTTSAALRVRLRPAMAERLPYSLKGKRSINRAIPSAGELV